MREQRLLRANEHYISLILRLDRMVRNGEGERSVFENMIAEAQMVRAIAAYELLAHRGTHDSLKNADRNRL